MNDKKEQLKRCGAEVNLTKREDQGIISRTVEEVWSEAARLPVPVFIIIGSLIYLLIKLL